MEETPQTNEKSSSTTTRQPLIIMLDYIKDRRIGDINDERSINHTSPNYTHHRQNVSEKQ